MVSASGLTVHLRRSFRPPADLPQSVRSGARLHCSQLIFKALQRAGVDPHMPWLANTFWQLLLSLVLFCCKHC